MVYGALADAVLLVHLGFVAFVVLGGLLVLRQRRLAWLHAPAAVWAVVVEYFGFLRPLTPLQIALRHRGGEAGYAGVF